MSVFKINISQTLNLGSIVGEELLPECSVHRKKKVCRYDTRSVSKVMSPVLTHLHACQIVRCVKSTHVLTGQCAKLLVCYLVSVLNNKCAILPMCQTWCAKLVVCQICLQLVTQ